MTDPEKTPCPAWSQWSSPPWSTEQTNSSATGIPSTSFDFGKEPYLPPKGKPRRSATAVSQPSQPTSVPEGSTGQSASTSGKPKKPRHQVSFSAKTQEIPPPDPETLEKCEWMEGEIAAIEEFQETVEERVETSGQSEHSEQSENPTRKKRDRSRRRSSSTPPARRRSHPELTATSQSWFGSLRSTMTGWCSQAGLVKWGIAAGIGLAIPFLPDITGHSLGDLRADATRIVSSSISRPVGDWVSKLSGIGGDYTQSGNETRDGLWNGMRSAYQNYSTSTS